MFWQGLAVLFVGVIVMGYGRSLSPPAPTSPDVVEVNVDDGLWYVETGPRSFDVVYDNTWSESRGDESLKKPTRATLQGINACNVRASIATEADAVALQTVLDNAELTCSSCGQEAASDDKRCEHCRKNPWAKPIAMTIRRRS
jgi:hypothetical protein